MSQVVFTALSKPIFLTGNYFTRYADQNSDLSVSGGSSLRHRLYDMDPAALWQGDVASDASDDSITLGLWSPSVALSRDVDFIAVLGHNLLAFDVDFSDNGGVSYPAANKQVYSALTLDYKIASLAATIAADKVKLTLHTTRTANSYKQVGAIVIAKGQLQAAVGLDLFQRKPPRMKPKEAKMFDNSTRRNFIGRSDASYSFNDFACGFSGLTETQADAMMDILLSPEPFVFIPEPGERPYNMYLGQAVPGTITRDYMYISRGGGERIMFDFEEAGGA